MSNKICPKCQTPHNKTGIFCSRKCANSRGTRTEDFKLKVSSKLKGKNYQTEESIRKGILSKGKTPFSDKMNTTCKVCDRDTNTKHRKTCSDECYRKLVKLQSQQHPSCGGQKHTHRTKIINIKNEIFVSESSYEVELSEILNDLNIYWIRPSFFWYKDVKGNSRRYYPDFYLPDYNLYLDPKNEYLIKTDINKIINASNQNNIYVIVIGKKHINLESIKEMVGDRGNAPLLPACKTGTLLLS